MVSDVDTKIEEISTMTIEERKELQKQVETLLNRLFRQKFLFAIVLLSGCKFFITEYLDNGLTIITVLPAVILLSACFLFRSAYRCEKVLKEIKETLIKMEQSDSVPE